MSWLVLLWDLMRFEYSVSGEVNQCAVNHYCRSLVFCQPPWLPGGCVAVKSLRQRHKQTHLEKQESLQQRAAATRGESITYIWFCFFQQLWLIKTAREKDPQEKHPHSTNTFFEFFWNKTWDKKKLIHQNEYNISELCCDPSGTALK